MRLVPVSGEELVKILYKKGFIIKRRKGSHVQLEDAVSDDSRPEN